MASAPSFGNAALTPVAANRLDSADHNPNTGRVATVRLFYCRLWLDLCTKYLFHSECPAASCLAIELTSTVRPDRIRNAAVRHQTLVIPLLIPVVNPLTREHAATIMFV